MAGIEIHGLEQSDEGCRPPHVEQQDRREEHCGGDADFVVQVDAQRKLERQHSRNRKRRDQPGVDVARSEPLQVGGEQQRGREADADAE